MDENIPLNISDFFVAGINYKKTDAETRGQFAINNDQYNIILEMAAAKNIESLFILSTCNRTEIYGFADSADDLVSLLCTQTTGTQQVFNKLAYIKNGVSAVEHLFNVGAGIDSQILGDYEIIGQLKKAVKFSMDRGFINCFMERLFNCVLQASKTIKNSTELSSGSVSVSFAAVQYIKRALVPSDTHKILVIGIGKMGSSTCKNIVDYLSGSQVTLINRTEEKAAGLAAELGMNYAPVEELTDYISSSEIILVATNASAPIVLKEHLVNKGDKLIIDLSIPYNVEPGCEELTNVTLVNVDELSKMRDDNLQKRQAEMPKAKAIIESHISVFLTWHQMRQTAPALKAVKTRLSDIYVQHFAETQVNSGKCSLNNAEGKIQRVVNDMAGKMKIKNECGCHYLEAINEFILAVAN
ncbi:glutamyl-tRNA reductase [Mucilaginibacter xinganensis]|uniref:Glutamyl-tRNA reductase n=1 Tax=Mucilaginibacter xinganensis TaxID=1234841 RepID=A0A223NR69_9SPHI|nr:glutamyl-tRNA reductase [Mucilaginibacter xinganensis]ASU31971.1 Glutamyl-tRNA reductase [Mucilaginibacter xinganensis]